MLSLFTFNCLGALYLQSSVSVTKLLTCNCLVLLKVTGKKLLEKGELQRRYTIIPLNKISAKTLDDRVVNAAKSLVREFFKIAFGVFFLGENSLLQFGSWVFSFHLQVGKDNVHTALSLVGYEADLRKAMEYVFGSTLVCDTLDNAKKVAFDRQVMTKTVTLGGDIFDPQGTLSGGENGNPLLSHSQLAR